MTTYSFDSLVNSKISGKFAASFHAVAWADRTFCEISYKQGWEGQDILQLRRLQASCLLTLWNLANFKDIVKDKATVDVLGMLYNIIVLSIDTLGRYYVY